MEPKSTSNSKIAGILSIIAGVSALFGSLVLGGIGVAAAAVFGSAVCDAPHGLPWLPLVLFVPLAFLIFALGVVAIIGGVSGVRRGHFWMLVVGAAAAIFCFLPLGLAALVFAALGEKEFATEP
jgi:hypothetical protein